MAQQARPKVMGQREPWRAQLAIWSIVVLEKREWSVRQVGRNRLGSGVGMYGIGERMWATYSAYCIAPSFFS